MADLPQRDRHEAAISKRLGTLANRHRAELARLMGNPPDIGRVPVEFWERVRRENEEELTALLLLIFIASADLHGATISDAAGLAYAGERAGLVAAEYAGTSADMARTLTLDAQERVRARGDEGLFGEDELRARMESIFGPSRVERIAVTETTAAITRGGEFAVAATVGFTDDDIWWTVGDGKVCPLCEPLHKQPRRVWMQEAPAGPPLHVNCRCYLQYKGREVAIDRITVRR